MLTFGQNPGEKLSWLYFLHICFWYLQGVYNSDFTQETEAKGADLTNLTFWSSFTQLWPSGDQVTKWAVLSFRILTSLTFGQALPSSDQLVTKWAVPSFTASASSHVLLTLPSQNQHPLNLSVLLSFSLSCFFFRCWEYVLSPMSLLASNSSLSC